MKKIINDIPFLNLVDLLHMPTIEEKIMLIVHNIVWTALILAIVTVAGVGFGMIEF